VTDVVDKKTRSRMMSGIKGKNTRPELLVCGALRKNGFRLRQHDNKLPGKPDIVLPEYRAVIFTHGCFWHGHDCHLFKWPSSHPEFWKEKINRNQAVDRRTYRLLKKNGWFVLTIWECALKGKTKKPFHKVIASVEHWLLYEKRSKTIRGRKL